MVNATPPDNTIASATKQALGVRRETHSSRTAAGRLQQQDGVADMRCDLRKRCTSTTSPVERKSVN